MIKDQVLGHGPQCDKPCACKGVTGINYGENSHGRREVHASHSRRWRTQMRKQCDKVVTALLSA